jgi:putative nucleotidyltransferase with HDIG domain
VLEAWEDRAVDIDVADFGTIHDLDHPEDYVLAQGHVGRGYPNERECQQLFSLHETLQHVIEHSHAVAQVALGMCALLNCRPDVTPLDTELVLGAALTHDIGKGTRRHEQAGAEILRSHGFHVAAEIAEEHFDLTLPSDMPVSEKAVVFLADKLVQGRSAVPMEQRFLNKVALYEHEVGARQAILGRLKRAQAVYQRLEREMGASPEQVACEALS